MTTIKKRGTHTHYNFLATRRRSVLLIAIGLIGIGVVCGQNTGTGSARSWSAAMDAAALAVSTADSSTVRALTDQILDRTLSGNVPASIRDRLFRVENDFLRGNQSAISEATLADAVTQLGLIVGGPTFTKTSAAQVRLLRVRMLAVVPNVVGSPQRAPKGFVVGNDMSPAGGAFLALLLLRQKLTNPDWQGDPDQWTTSVARQARVPQQVSNQLAVQSLPPILSSNLQHLTNGLREESSDVTVGIHIMLDRVGLHR